MKRTKVKYRQLDQVLMGLGFTREFVQGKPPSPPAVHYNHAPSGAWISIPPYRPSERVWDWHLIATRMTLDNFSIAEPDVFEAELLKAG